VKASAQTDAAKMTVTTNPYLSGDYVARNPTYHVEDSAWKARYLMQMIAKHNLSPRSVAEVGCGAGEILRVLHDNLPDTIFHGYEISPQAYSLCQTRAGTRLHFYCEDLLASVTERFDLLLCIDVFEHVEDCFSFLRQLRSKADFKMFHIPLDMSVQYVWRSKPILRQRELVGHLHYFSKETALATLRETGYEIIDWFYTPGAAENPRSMKARLANAPRRLVSMISPDISARILGGYSLLVLAR
jgi:hypothetical protein